MRFTGRWTHRMTLAFRAWPREPQAHRLAVMAKEWSVDGLTYNRNEHLEACHRIGQKNFAAWELSDEDALTLSASGTAGAVVERMRIKCPGTMDVRAKKECWLEADVTVYPDACTRAYSAATYTARTLECPWDALADTLAEKWRRADEIQKNHMASSYGKKRNEEWLKTVEPRTFDGFELHETADVIDIPKIAESILSGKVVVFKAGAIDAETFSELRDKLNYYTVPGRAPDEEGGLYRGYQLGDGVIRWTRRTVEGDPDHGPEAHLRKMHEATRSAGQSRRRTIFVGQVVTRISERFGVSRQRAMSVFLEEGIVDYLVRSYDAAAEAGKLYVHGNPEKDLRGFISEAVRIVAFYIEGVMGREVA